ncbi:MAG: D-sedoheptulose-7-phosphate isomerase, partial [Mycobacteriaceae bacterium]
MPGCTRVRAVRPPLGRIRRSTGVAALGVIVYWGPKFGSSFAPSATEASRGTVATGIEEAAEMRTNPHALDAVVTAAFAEREEPVRRLAADAERVAGACHDMALRFSRGGTLLVFGIGTSATDAQHISVEFVHPVIVGKRALPALSLVSDIATVLGVAERQGLDDVFSCQLSILGKPVDIALGVSADGECRNVLRGLESAHRAGMLTVALVGGDGGAIAASRCVDHCFTVASRNPRLVKEVHVTTYHLLWELAHVFFDQPGLLDEEAPRPAANAEIEALYPFLYAGTTSLPAVLDSVAASTRDKCAEILTLRRAMGEQQRKPLAECARRLAEAFAGGGKLLTFGNGGSSTDAQDVAHTFLGSPDGVGLPALCLTSDIAVVTALSNDVGFDVVFARQVRAFGRPGDVAFGISTSGGSSNVLAAFNEAKRLGMVTVGLSGYGGGKMADLASLDMVFAVPSSSVHRVQEVQTTLYHVLWEATQA